MRPNTRSPVTTMLLLLAATTAGLTLMWVTAANANARTYVGHTAGGGTIALRASAGHVRQVRASIPATCENVHGGTWRRRLEVNVRVTLALRSGRFSVGGEAPNGVKGELRGRLRGGAISGQVRLTLFDLDPIADPHDDSYLCDTGTRRFRAY